MSKIIIDGPLATLSSAAIINRALFQGLSKFGHDVFASPAHGNSVIRGDDGDGELKIAAQKVRDDIEPDITIRNVWPPRFVRPRTGKLIMIQPWEFGSIPLSWITDFNMGADQVWVPSNFVRDVFIRDGLPTDKVQRVPNGFDPEVFRPDGARYPLKTKKSFKFLFVGGAIPRKGIDILLTAYSSVFGSVDDVCLVIKDFGADSFYKEMTFRNKILAFAERPGVAEIEYIDSTLTQLDLAALYRSCDVLVHPYRGEGFGLPILESMASGTPPMVTSGGPAPEFCRSEYSVLLKCDEKLLDDKQVFGMQTVSYPSIFKVSLDDLAEKILWASKNRNVLRELGRNGASYARERWTWNAAVREADRRLNELAENRQPASPLSL